MPDTLGYRKIFGVVVPSVNTVVQPELDAMRPPGVTNQTARIFVPHIPLVDEPSFIRHVETMRSGITTAVEQIATCTPDHLVMGLSLEAFWDGLEGSTRLRESLERLAGCGVSMGSDGLLAALGLYGPRRIAILTPHPPLGDARVKSYFTEAGYDVVRMTGLSAGSGLAIARIADEELRAALADLDGPDVDALVQVGTNLPMARLAAEAERRLGKPVLAVNTATYWHALRAAGIPDRIEGFGSLLDRY